MTDSNTSGRVAGLLARISFRMPKLLAARKNFFFSFGLCLLFFYPCIRGRGTTGSFLFSPDSLSWYFPSFAKSHALLSRGHFVALDYTAFNGSVDFFLSPVFPYFNPLIVLHGLLVPTSWATNSGLFAAIVVFIAAHMFIACYFMLKWMQEYLDTRFSTAAIAATLFAFGLPTIGQTGQLSFLVCIVYLPWVVYATTRHAREPSFGSAVAAAVPVLFCLLGGYLPLAAFSLLLAVLIVASAVMLDDRIGSREARIRALLRASAP